MAVALRMLPEIFIEIDSVAIQIFLVSILKISFREIRFSKLQLCVPLGAGGSFNFLEYSRVF